MALTVEGYNQITERIVNRTIEIPAGKNAHELMEWLNGYAEAQKNVIEIIMQLKKEVTQK